MRRVAVGEWVLSLVMPPERASATAGDLVESARGTSSFWFAVTRTALGAVMGQISAGLIGKAVLCAILLSFTVRFLATAIIYAGLTGSRPGRTSYVVLAAAVLGMTVSARGLMARFFAGREMGAWAAIALYVTLVVSWLELAPQADRLTGLHFFYVGPVELVLMLVGTILARRKWLRQGGTLA